MNGDDAHGEVGIAHVITPSTSGAQQAADILIALYDQLKDSGRSDAAIKKDWNMTSYEIDLPARVIISWRNMEILM